MKLILQRIYNCPTYAIGKLYIDGVYFCDVIEDTDRGLDQGWTLAKIRSRKIASKTAIPTGTYTVNMNTVSPKFSQKPFYYRNCNYGRMPRLLNVPGYDGILIHGGKVTDQRNNMLYGASSYGNETWSAGCLIVGRNTVKGRVTHSAETLLALYKKLSEANRRGEKISITITRKYAV